MRLQTPSSRPCAVSLKAKSRRATSQLGSPKAWKLQTKILNYCYTLLGRSSPRNAVVQNRYRILGRISCLLIPVSLTLATLSLNWRRQYLTSYGANQTLALLQIVAKIHDIFITLSMTDVLLYHLRRQLIADSGTSYGVFSAAYSVGFGALPFSRTFWRPLLSTLAHRRSQWHARALVCLTLIASIIGLAGNPAASIALVPRLDWWPSQDLFSYMEPNGNVQTLS